MEKNKFSYRNSPILKALETGSLIDTGFYAIDKEFCVNNGEKILKMWKTNAPKFKDNITKISNTFYEAMQLAKDKLCKAEFINELENQMGVIIFDKITNCYAINNNGNTLTVGIISFYESTITSFIEVDITKETGFIELKPICWVSNTFDNKEEFMFGITAEVVLLMTFIKYAKIETKILPANSKVKTERNKYVNETKSKIKLLDSTWFTNLVKSDGFKVRGHFRLQPYGTGRTERELIWVQEFEKTGYTAKAKKLSIYPEIN